METMSFGMRLKQLRHNKELSQQQLSDLIGMNRATYARYETNDNQADYETLLKLADYFEVSVDFLLGRTANPDPIDKLSNIEIFNVAYFEVQKEKLSEQEAAHLKESLEMYRLLQKKRSQDRNQS